MNVKFLKVRLCWNEMKWNELFSTLPEKLEQSPNSVKVSVSVTDRTLKGSNVPTSSRGSRMWRACPITPITRTCFKNIKGRLQYLKAKTRIRMDIGLIDSMTGRTSFVTFRSHLWNLKINSFHCSGPQYDQQLGEMIRPRKKLMHFIRKRFISL